MQNANVTAENAKIYIKKASINQLKTLESAIKIRRNTLEKNNTQTTSNNNRWRGKPCYPGQQHGINCNSNATTWSG